MVFHNNFPRFHAPVTTFACRWLLHQMILFVVPLNLNFNDIGAIGMFQLLLRTQVNKTSIKMIKQVM